MKLLLILLAIIFISGCVQVQEEVNTKFCQSDSDCVSAECCHASSCVNTTYALDCTEVMCTMECVAGTMDCGGYCACINNTCRAIIS